MKRFEINTRSNWEQKVENLGLVWHTVDGRPYWNEAAYYSFTLAQIEEIETATTELYGLFLDAGQAIIDRNLFSGFGIPRWCHDAIRRAWDAEPPALNFGRFDLGYNGKAPPKLFEFNCDTPTSLVEAAVIQWDWKETAFPRLDQFNSLHDKLVAKWADIRPVLPVAGVTFTHAADDAGEDTVTVAYLRDTARLAGVSNSSIVVDDIGWDKAAESLSM